MRTIDTIVIHCAATPPNLDIGAAEIREWHTLGNGWRDIGYHFVIRRDGTVEPGRDLDDDGNTVEEVGAHAYGFNSHTIGVCLVGGKGSRPTDSIHMHFTRDQVTALKAVVATLRGSFGRLRVIGHNDLTDSKACPGFQVTEIFSRD